MQHVIVIGSGIGGLEVGCLLAQQGYAVTVLEQNIRPGGCLQSFVRNGLHFETGCHFVGGLKRWTPIWKLFRQLGLNRLSWKSVKEHEIYIGDNCYHLPCGARQAQAYLTKCFPHQKEAIKTYMQTLRTIAHCPLDQTTPYWQQNAWEWLSQTITDERLRDVLSAMSIIIDMDRQRLPLFEYAEVMYGFITSTKRVQGGGEEIITHLCQRLKRYNGELRCGCEVSRIIDANGRVTGVELTNGERIEADIVISDIQPAATMRLLDDNSSMRPVYKRRITNLPSMPGCFTVNIQLREPLRTDRRQGPIYVHRAGTTIWNDTDKRVNHILIYTYPNQSAIDILTPMDWQEVEAWCEHPMGQRGDEYDQLKKKKAKQCIDLALTAIPELQEQIVQTWSSTPLTWQHYLRSEKGSAYGTYKDCRSIATTLITPRTPLEGLYLTGQSLVLHGIVGTTMSAGFTINQLAISN